jgi:serine/threonine protein kinase
LAASKDETLVDAVIMEWLEGETLSDRLSAGNPLGVAPAKQFCLEIIAGVNHIHSCGLTHSDLHVGNVILTAVGAKIIDIDYSSANSLRKLSASSRHQRILDDIITAQHLIWMTFLRLTDMALEDRYLLQQQLRSCQTIASLREAVATIPDSIAAPPIPKKRATPVPKSPQKQVGQAIERGRLATLRELLIDAAQHTVSKLQDDRFSLNENISDESLRLRISEFESIVKPSAAVLASAAYWSNSDEIVDLIVESLDLIGNAFETRHMQSGGLKTWIDLRHYPRLIAMYAAGLGAVARRQYGVLRELMENTTYFEFGSNRVQMSTTVWSWKSNYTRMWNENVLGRDLISPISQHLEQILRPSFNDLVPQSQRFERIFDRFELFVGLAEYHRSKSSAFPWGPTGSFIWRNRGEDSVMREVTSEFQTQNANWAPLSAGLFGGNAEEFKSTLAGYVEFLNRVAWQYR